MKLSVTRKANVRSRLKKVDAVIEAVRASGVECTALVRLPPFYANVMLMRAIRSAPLSYRRRARCRRGTSTPSSRARRGITANLSSSCPSGLGCVIYIYSHTIAHSLAIQLTQRVNPKGF